MAKVDKETFDISRKELDVSKVSSRAKDDHDNENDHDISKVVKTDAKKKEKSKLQKFSETFFGGDLKDVFSYVFFDVIVPSAKDMLFDTIKNGTQRLIYGTDSNPQPTRVGRYTSYSSIGYRSPVRRHDISPNGSVISPMRREFDDIVFSSHEDAEQVIAALVDAVDHYGQVSVADFYKASGVTPEYTDYNIGWRSLSRTSIARIRDGWVINFPKLENLNQ